MDQRVIQLLIDSFGQILLPGLTMTIPLTVISFSLAMVIAIITALVQFANIRVLKQIARFYIWVVRGTPLQRWSWTVWIYAGFRAEISHRPACLPFRAGIVHEVSGWPHDERDSGLAE